MYGLEDDVAARLYLKYETFTGKSNKNRYSNSETHREINDFTVKTRDQERRKGTIDDLEL